MKTYLSLIIGCTVMLGCSGGGSSSPTPGADRNIIATQQASISIPASGGTVTLPQVGYDGSSMQFAPSAATLTATAMTATGPLAKAPPSSLWSVCLMADQSEMLVFQTTAQMSKVPALTVTGGIATGVAFNDDVPSTWYGLELFDASAPSGTGPIYVAKATSIGGLVSFAPGPSPWNIAANHQYIFAIVSSQSVPCGPGGGVTE
jgi:hypothetical protein